MGHTDHDQPLGLLDTIRIGLRVTQGLPVGLVRLVDLVLGAVADENGLAAPFDDHLFLSGWMKCWTSKT